MSIVLKGSSAQVLIAGILLLSRSRSFGLRVEVSALGQANDIAAVRGPALLHSAVLCGCRVGRGHGEGSVVVLPGPASAPLQVCLSPDGIGPWFLVDRTGAGQHPATRDFVRLCRDARPEARQLAAQLRRGLSRLGCASEPAVLDLLFGAQVQPLARVALALRAGRAMTGQVGDPLTRFLRPGVALPDPLSGPPSPESLAAILASPGHPILAALQPAPRAVVIEWLGSLLQLSAETGGEYSMLAGALAELGSHIASLPSTAILPPLDAPTEHVAAALGAALGATAGETDASVGLRDTFLFLGGRFTDEARYPVNLDGPPPPADPLERWRWLCAAARAAGDTADTLWRRIMDPVQ